MVVKSQTQLAALRKAGRATATLLQELAQLAKPGVTTGELDEYARAYIERIGGDPVFHTQNGFPAAINTSVNDEAVHGVPGNRTLRDGDLLSIDCGIGVDGYCGDSTITIGIGTPARLSKKRRQVMEVAREALRRGIAAAQVGNRVGDIGYAMQSYVETTGFHLLREYTGHGLGKRLWEEPTVPAVGRPGTGPTLVKGLVITIEPIVVAGKPIVFVDDDGWTVRTVDGQSVAQFEHTIMIAPDGPEVFTTI